MVELWNFCFQKSPHLPASKELVDNDLVGNQKRFHPGEPLLWSFYGDRYRRTALPADTRSNWHAALLRFSQGEIGRQEFAAALGGWLDAVFPVLEPILDDLVTGGVHSIRYLQDFGPSPPVTALAMRHPGLLQRMRQGLFEVRLVAAIVLLWLRGSYEDVVGLQRPYSADRMTVRGPVFPTRRQAPQTALGASEPHRLL